MSIEPPPCTNADDDENWLHPSAAASRLLRRYQRGMPTGPRPYAQMGQELGISEAQVLSALRALYAAGVLSRVGPVFKAGSLGASTLAAMAVPQDRLDAVADYVSSFDEVNHNYEREHTINLWFVVTAADEATLQGVLDSIALHTGIEVMDLPLEQAFHIDLAFT